MPLSYPNFSRSEYSFLNQNLCIVDYFLQLATVDAEIASLKTQLEDARKAVKTQGKGLQKAVLDEVKAYEDFTKIDGTKGIEDYRRCVLGPYNPITQDKKDRAIARIFQSYAKFDTKAFDEDFKAVYADEILRTAECKKEVQSLTTRLNFQITKRNELIADAMVNVFVSGPPKKFSTTQITDDFTAEQMTELIIKRFVEDWKYRVGKFEVPTTVTGVGIYTLSPARREVWMDAYRKLNLDKIKRTRGYQYFVAPIEESPMTTPTVLRGEDG